MRGYGEGRDRGSRRRGTRGHSLSCTAATPQSNRTPTPATRTRLTPAAFAVASTAAVDAVGEPIAFQRTDDAAVTSALVAHAEARTAARFRRPTRLLDSSLTAGRTALLAFEGIMPVEGGVPIVVGGRVVGGVGVSGVTARRDAQCAHGGANAVRP